MLLWRVSKELQNPPKVGFEEPSKELNIGSHISIKKCQFISIVRLGYNELPLLTKVLVLRYNELELV